MKTTTAISLVLLLLSSTAAPAVTLEQCKELDQRNIDVIKARYAARDKNLFKDESHIVITSRPMRIAIAQIDYLTRQIDAWNHSSNVESGFEEKPEILAQFRAAPANSMGVSEQEKSALLRNIENSRDFLGLFSAIVDFTKLLESRHISVEFNKRNPYGPVYEYCMVIANELGHNQKIVTSIDISRVEEGWLLLRYSKDLAENNKKMQSYLAFNTCEEVAKSGGERDEYYRAMAVETSCKWVNTPPSLGGIPFPDTKEVCEEKEVPYEKASKSQIKEAWKNFERYIKNIESLFER